jgi:hypothetical protein
MKKKIYDIQFDASEDSVQGMFTISFVKNPAIKEEFIALSEHEEAVLESVHLSEEKREVVGAVLVPNKLIRRVDEERGEFYIRFSEETISALVLKMSKEGHFNSYNRNHVSGDVLENVYLTEQWIKESDNDKSADYGFGDLPVGTFFIKCKVEDDDTWARVKSGELRGFSAELSTYLVSTNLSQMDENKEDIRLSEEQVSSIAEAVVSALKAQEKESEPTLTEEKELLMSSSYWSVSSSGTVMLESEGLSMYFNIGEDVVNTIKEAIVPAAKETVEDVELSEQTNEGSDEAVNLEEQATEEEAEGSEDSGVSAEVSEALPEVSESEAAEAVSAEPEVEEEISLSEEEAEKLLLAEQEEAEAEEVKLSAEPRRVLRGSKEFREIMHGKA